MSVLRSLLRCLDQQTNRHFYINLKCTQRLRYVSLCLALQYMGDIDTQINSISSAVDLSSFKILSTDMEKTLNDFKNSGIGSLNFTSINDTVSID